MCGTAPSSPLTRRICNQLVQHLLIIHGGHIGGRTHELVSAIGAGVTAAQEAVEARTLPALQADIDDLLWAHALLIGTPEHFGYMSGAVKDFMDRTFYPAAGKVDGLPYAIFVSAGNDGTGAVNAIERIALGYKWKKVAAPLIVKGDVTAADLQRCRELGQVIAAGLALGIL
jgi:multimeric flavodoxin WrbA